MTNDQLIPNLFRTEYRKLISVLSSLFGIDHIETAEDIVSETFLAATELWRVKGTPPNPTAWLYTVAKNKATNQLKRNSVFRNKVIPAVRDSSETSIEIDLDLSDQHINDSQLAMMFTVCNPCISSEAQISLALSLLCGFGTAEIADAFLTSSESVYKRLQRAKKKLRDERIDIAVPSREEVDKRLSNVLTTLYLMFSEGYYSTSHNLVLRKDICSEAMRLCHLLIDNERSNHPEVAALLSIMCFHSSRFDTRLDSAGELVLYAQQDSSQWNQELIEAGVFYLNMSSTGERLSKYHLEAGIAYWHTVKEDTTEKWERILQLYNRLLQIEYSPMAALNRTYALAKSNGNHAAIIEAEKLTTLQDNVFYSMLMGTLYESIDNIKALSHFEHACSIAVSTLDRTLITKKIASLKASVN